MPKRALSANQPEERKQAAKERFWAMTQELQKRMARSDPNEVQGAIEEAIKEIRREKRRADNARKSA